MPVNEVTAARRIQKVDEVFPVGTEVQVLVIDADPSRAKLVVSAKGLELAKERAEFDKYFKDQENETPTSTLGDVLSGLNLFDEKEDK